MQEVSKYTVFNIREYLNGNNEELGEDDLRQVLSEFSCEKNPDVERFAKEQSIEFAKKQQSVTYLVFSTEDAELVGYFAITIKPITVNAESFSNTIKKKLARVSELNEQNHTYNMHANSGGRKGCMKKKGESVEEYQKILEEREAEKQAALKALEA